MADSYWLDQLRAGWEESDRQGFGGRLVRWPDLADDHREVVRPENNEQLEAEFRRDIAEAKSEAYPRLY